MPFQNNNDAILLPSNNDKPTKLFKPSDNKVNAHENKIMTHQMSSLDKNSKHALAHHGNKFDTAEISH